MAGFQALIDGWFSAPLTPQQLLEIPNFGVKTLETVYAALEKIGYYRPSQQPMEEVNRPPAPKVFALLRE